MAFGQRSDLDTGDRTHDLSGSSFVVQVHRSLHRQALSADQADEVVASWHTTVVSRIAQLPGGSTGRWRRVFSRPATKAAPAVARCDLDRRAPQLNDADAGCGERAMAI